MDEIEIAGVLRDLRHLKPFVVNLAGKGKEGEDLRVAVYFRLHTISRACQPNEVANMLDENGQRRVFCEDRYAFSLGLPEIAKRMILQKYYCWESSDRNRILHYAILDAAPGRIRELQDGEHQVIYFYLYPANGKTADVDLHVTSCYMNNMRFGNVKRRFDTHMLLRKCLFDKKRLP
jgi:hypothetical protein